MVSIIKIIDHDNMDHRVKRMGAVNFTCLMVHFTLGFLKIIILVDLESINGLMAGNLTASGN